MSRQPAQAEKGGKARHRRGDRPHQGARPPGRHRPRGCRSRRLARTAFDQLRQRLAESFEAALRLAEGRAMALEMDSTEPAGAGSAAREHLFNAKFACPVCSYSISELEPRLFSFNSPVGACPTCDGWAQRISSTRRAWWPSPR
jgi:excinuclease ABC subunit A